MNKALTIAGSDSGGGAGIQADLKTFTAFGVFGTSAITALTAQNTIGVQGVFEVSPEFVREQIKSVISDIDVDAAKTGMLSNEAIVDTVAEAIKDFNISNLVVDPVMVAKSGDALLKESAELAVKSKLLPLAKVITPNKMEAEALINRTIESKDDLQNAAKYLKESGCEWVVIKGGHFQDKAKSVDVVYNGSDFSYLESDRYDTKNTHGTGCTFSAAIAAGLAKGYEPLKAIAMAKKFISQAIRDNVPIGNGYGPTNHFVGTSSVW